MKILLVGAAGHMGRAVAACAGQLDDAGIRAGVDVAPCEEADFPLFRSVAEAPSDADVIIDFSRPESLEGILSYCEKNGAGAVLATTGYTEAQMDRIRQASASVAIFQAPNFSIGIALLCELAKDAARVLGDRSDIEIVERHHNRKVDAPSGTALAIADAVADVIPGAGEYVYGRHGASEKRSPGEIGIHAIRGGTLVGDHDVMFLSPNEELDISHRAYSRDIFAQGALAAARFLTEKKSGLYDMRNLLQAMGLRSSEETGR